jgi:hypothetical protein
MEIKDLQLALATDTFQSSLRNEFIDICHYQGYTSLPGAQLRYFAKSQNTVIALFGFGDAA